MNRRTDWVDHLLGIMAVLFIVLCILIIKEAKAHHDEKAPPATPEVWTGPPIQQCDKELWERIKDGCEEEQQRPDPDEDKVERFWCERSNGTYTDGECSIGDNY